jgi:hypothetical protein
VSSYICTCIYDASVQRYISQMDLCDKVSSVVDIENGMFLINSSIADGLSRYTHVLALHKPDSSCATWTCWQDDIPYGVSSIDENNENFCNAIAILNEGKTSCRTLNFETKEACIDTLKQIINRIDDNQTSKQPCRSVMRPTHTFKQKKLTSSPRHALYLQSTNSNATSFRLLSHDRWFAMSRSQQQNLISSVTDEGPLFITSHQHELLSNSNSAKFYENYREVRPALGGPLFNSLRKFMDIVPGHLLLVPSFVSAATDAPLQMIKLELPAHANDLCRSRTNWTSTTGRHGAIARNDLHTGITSISQIH